MHIPFGDSGLELDCDLTGAEVFESVIGTLKADAGEDEIVRAAMAAPIAPPRLAELACGKKTDCIIVSDHMRPVPSRHILPFMLAELRKGNPDIDITLLIATGFHRPSTHEELVSKVGENLNWWMRLTHAKAPNIHLNTYVQTQNAIKKVKALEYCSMLLADGADSCMIMGVKNDMVNYLSDNNVALYGHVDALSGWQTAQYDGYKRLGQTADEAYKIYRQAYEYQENGMKAMTIELTPREVAEAISKKLTMPMSRSPLPTSVFLSRVSVQSVPAVSCRPSTDICRFASSADIAAPE